MTGQTRLSRTSKSTVFTEETLTIRGALHLKKTLKNQFGLSASVNLRLDAVEIVIHSPSSRNQVFFFLDMQDVDVEVFIVKKMDAQAINRLKDIIKLLSQKKLSEMVSYIQLDPNFNQVSMKHLGKDLCMYMMSHDTHLSADERLRLAISLLDQVDRLHANDVTHGDIKPENLIVSESATLQLIDWDNCSTGQFGKGPYGTFQYNGPEGHSYSEEIDRHALEMWAVGHVLFILFTESPPVIIMNSLGWYTEEYKLYIQHGLAYVIEKTPDLKETWDGVDARVRDILLLLLSRKALDRPSAREAHERFKRIGRSKKRKLQNHE